MNLRVFLDANALFTAACNPDGLARLLIELRRLKVLELLASSLAMEEAIINLRLKKPAALEELESMSPLLEMISIPAGFNARLDLPADDLLIFAGAVAARSTHLLTGDKKDFGPFFNKPDETAGIRIQPVRQFFDERFTP